MIVDAHAHLGLDEVFDEDFTEAALLASQREHGITATLVQPATVHNLSGVQRQHDAVADLVRRYPGRFYGVANPNPHLPGDEYEREVRRCVEDLGFKALKLHPLAHAVNPTGRHGLRVFDVAVALRIPLIVHTGVGIPWAAPALLEPLATAHPELKIVLAHAGGMIMAGEAGQLAERHANVYLECSWMGGFMVRAWVRQLGAGRVLFGSDHAENAATELTKFRSLGLNAEQLNAVLGGTAASIFGLAAS
jgi:predicted TIM-barrel fold metal-dependent hydrolase